MLLSKVVQRFIQLWCQELAHVGWAMRCRCKECKLFVHDPTAGEAQHYCSAKHRTDEQAPEDAEAAPEMLDGTDPAPALQLTASSVPAALPEGASSTLYEAVL
jgi:hypothetical protein